MPLGIQANAATMRIQVCRGGGKGKIPYEAMSTNNTILSLHVSKDHKQLALSLWEECNTQLPTIKW